MTDLLLGHTSFCAVLRANKFSAEKITRFPCLISLVSRDTSDTALVLEVEAYLPKLIHTCFLSCGRSIAHKCSRLLMMCARYVYEIICNSFLAVVVL